MFETAEVGNRLDKAAFDQAAPAVRAALLAAQHRAAAGDFSTILLVGGLEGAGRVELAHHLLEWLDARGVQTRVFAEPTEEERQRPPLWRFWMALPPRGRIGLFLGSWYNRPLWQCFRGRLTPEALDQELDRVADFERMLHADGVLLLKIWLHLSQPALRARLRRIQADPAERWRIGKNDRKLLKRYDAYVSLADHVLRRTNLGEAPWNIIEAADPRYRDLTVSQLVERTLRERLDRPPAPPPPKPDLPKPAPVNVLNHLDLTLSASREEYDRKLPRLQAKVSKLTRKLHDRGRSMIIVFEGTDAAGKGGAIRRLAYAMDVRDVQVIAVAAPTDEEKAHPYLWRFWRHLPRQGRVTIYDRSWYGRVLVERLEGFCSPADWQRAYAEITAFEEELTRFGIILIKFWLALSPDEQLRRFQDREITPFKQYKITEEDWRNRSKWDAYEAAACDMIEKTSTASTPWTLVEADSKEFARLKVLRTVVERLREELQ
jgi:polyphosphate:AMP phosphotransferase